MDNLDYLVKFTNSLENGGSIEVKQIKYPPTVGIEVFDCQMGDSNAGSIKVEIYTQHTGWDRPPIVTVDKQLDKEWFNYFNNQFDAIWERGAIYKPSDLEWKNQASIVIIA